MVDRTKSRSSRSFTRVWGQSLPFHTCSGGSNHGPGPFHRFGWKTWKMVSVFSRHSFKSRVLPSSQPWGSYGGSWGRSRREIQWGEEEGLFAFVPVCTYKRLWGGPSV